MICYSHPQSQAAGTCRGCGKGLCGTCAREFVSDMGLVCSAACKEKADKLNAMNERAFKIYGIGADKPRGLPTGVVMPAIMGLGFCAWGLVDYLIWKTPLTYFMLAMGLLFIFGSCYALRKYREHGLNV